MEQSRNKAMHVAEETLEVFEEYKRQFFEVIEREMESARKQAEQESVNIITEAKQKAQQIAEKVARETRKESARILTESAGLREQMISEAERFARIGARLEQNVEQELERAIEKVRQEACVVAKATQKAEMTISEVRNKLHDEIEESVRVITEMRQKLEQVTEGTEHEAREEFEHRGEPTRSTPEVTHEREEIVEPTAAEKHDSASREVSEDNLLGGTLELSITPPGDSASLRWLLRCLSETPGLEILSEGEPTDETTTVSVFISKPLPLLGILKGMPPVKDAAKKNKNVQVMLETSAGKG